MTAFVDQLRNVLGGTTEGPWKASWSTPNTPGMEDCGVAVVVVEVGEEAVAYLGDDEQSVRDSGLIAAAPELLSEALRRLDPGDTDIEVVIEVLASLLDDLEVEGPDAPYSSAVRAAIRLLRRQAFGEPS